MLIHKYFSWIAFFSAMSILSGSISKANDQLAAVQAIQLFLNLPSQTEHLRAAYDGTDPVNSKHCLVILESNPSSARFIISKDDANTEDIYVDVNSQGRNEEGDYIQVTKILNYPRSLLINLYIQRNKKPGVCGNQTLLLNKDKYGRLVSVSVSDGVGISTCSDLTPR